MHDLALEPWSLCLEVNARRYEEGPGVKHLARIASRPVTWVIKIKHAGLGVLGQSLEKWTLPAPSNKLQAASDKQQAPSKKRLDSLSYP